MNRDDENEEARSGGPSSVEHADDFSTWSKRPAPEPHDKPQPQRGEDNGHGQEQQKCADAFGRGEEEGHPEDLPHDLPKVPTARIILLALIFIALIVALFIVGYLPHHRANVKLQQQSAAVQNAKPVVLVSKPILSNAAVDVDLPGDALALQQTSMYPRANGYLSKLYVDIGDHVTQGQLLAEISAPEIDAQLASARAAVLQAVANESSSQTNYNLAKTTLERYQGFFKSGGVTQQQLDERQTTFTQADATLKAAQASVGSANAEVQRLSTLVGYQKIVAPFQGTITYRPYDIGALLNPASTGPGLEIFDIARTDILRVFVNVPQSYSTDIHTGQAAEFLVRNYPGEAFNGVIVRTAGSIDLRTRTLRIEVDFPNDNGRLFAGMYGTVRLHVPRQSPQIIIPTSALVFDAKGLRVAVVDDEKKIHLRNITVGRDFGTTIEVLDGLKGQERVVDNPGEKLAEDVEVDVHQAPSNGTGTQPEQPHTPPTKSQKQARADG